MYLTTEFSSKWIGHAGHAAYPLRSADLTRLNFGLCGFVRDVVTCSDAYTPQWAAPVRRFIGYGGRLWTFVQVSYETFAIVRSTLTM